MNTIQASKLETYKRKWALGLEVLIVQFSHYLNKEENLFWLQSDKYLKIFEHLLCWYPAQNSGKPLMTKKSALFSVCSIILYHFILTRKHWPVCSWVLRVFDAQIHCWIWLFAVWLKICIYPKKSHQNQSPPQIKKDWFFFQDAVLLNL